MRAPHDDRSSRRAAALREIVLGLADLPSDDVNNVVDLIEAGELPLALETLCTQIHEYDVDLRREERDGLGILGGELGVSVAYLLGDPWATKGGDECG